jgi:tetratricopeptide (TPR) repeat protein/TolB-like protein
LTAWSLVLALAASARTLVLPFEDLSSDPAHRWEGSALEEAISSHLQSAGIDVVDFVSRNRQLRDKGFQAGEPVTRASAIVLAKDLGAERLVLGTLRHADGRVEVEARLIDLVKGSTIGVVADRGSPDALARLSNQVAKNLFRLERDAPPPGFADSAERRERIHAGALAESARARVSFDPAEQERLLEEAIRLAPDYLEARLALGRLLLEKGRAREAVDVLASIRGQGRVYEQAYFDLGRAYLDAGEPRLAFDVFRTLAALPEGGAASHNNLGVAVMRLGRYVEAAEAFESALSLGGETKSYLFNLGWSQWRAGKGAKALTLFEKLSEADPLDAQAHFLLSAAASSQARHELSEKSRGTALVLAPQLENVDATIVDGWERVVRGPDDAGSLSWAMVPVDFEEDVVGLTELFDARELRSRGRTDEAIQLLQKSLYRDPNAVDSRRELADVYCLAGDLDQAASELSILLWTEPSAEIHIQLARVYLQMQDQDKAVVEVEKALALDPGHREALTLRTSIQEP